MSALLETSDLAVGYANRRTGGTIVARALDLRVAPGTFICLLGPNGAGKSTLLRTLAGVQEPLGGSISLEGQPLDALESQVRAQRIAVVLTEKPAAATLRVTDVVALGRYPHTGWFGQLEPRDLQIVDDSLKLVGADDVADRFIGDLSDGERQRVMIARALAQSGLLLLLDEVTAFLDLPSRVRTMTLLRGLVRERGCAVVLSSHDLDLALRLADEVWLMKGDGALRQGTPEDLVLDGSLGAAFGTEEVALDADSGAFVLRERGGPRVALEGSGATRLWTERALLRTGFTPVVAGEECEFAIRVENDGSRPRWELRLEDGYESSESMGALLRRLRDAS